jgi:hypothetical protein
MDQNVELMKPAGPIGPATESSQKSQYSFYYRTFAQLLNIVWMVIIFYSCFANKPSHFVVCGKHNHHLSKIDLYICSCYRNTFLLNFDVVVGISRSILMWVVKLTAAFLSTQHQQSNHLPSA